MEIGLNFVLATPTIVFNYFISVCKNKRRQIDIVYCDLSIVLAFTKVGVAD